MRFLVLKEIKILLAILLVFVAIIAFSGPGCYESHQEAWEACDRKYNGKCKYLGSSYELCETQEVSMLDKLFSKPYKACMKIIEREGIPERYCKTKSGREFVFNNQ